MPRPAQMVAHLVVVLPFLEAGDLGAQGLRRVAVILRVQCIHVALQTFVVLIRHAGCHGGLQQVLVDVMGMPGCESRARLVVHHGAGIAAGGRHRLHPIAYLCFHRTHFIVAPDCDFEPCQAFVRVELRQAQPVAAGHDLVRAGHDTKCCIQIGGRAGHGADHRDIRLAAHVPGRRVAPHPEQVVGGLVAEHAAEMAGIADRAADIGARIQTGKPGG